MERQNKMFPVIDDFVELITNSDFSENLRKKLRETKSNIWGATSNSTRRVHLPCYPGDVVYYYDKEKGTAISLVVDSVTLAESSIGLVCSKPLFSFLSKETLERYSFTVEKDLGVTLFTSLDSIVKCDYESKLLSHEANDLLLCLQVMMLNGKAVKYNVHICSRTCDQFFFFKDFESAYSKYMELKSCMSTDMQ